MAKATSEHFKSSELIDDAEWQVIEKEEGLKQPDMATYDHLPVCERPHFESTVGVFIMLNAVFMALQLDLVEGSATKWPWMMVDGMFCCVFASEIAFRIYCLGFYTYASQKKYLFDTLLVALNIVDSAIQLSGSDSTGLQAFSALRILRVFKIVKMLRIVRIIEDLHLIVIGLISAVKSLQWVALMLGLVVFIVAIVFKILVGNECSTPVFQESFIYHFGLASNAEATEKCEEFWGNIPRSMYTLYQVTTMESWSQVIARPIWDIRPSYVIIILAFQFLTTFGLLNIVVAAVVDGTMNSSDEFVVEKKTIKTTVSHLEIVRSIFEQSVGTDGKVTKEKFVPLLSQGAIRRKLLTMDISYDDPSQIFRIIDADGLGAITLTELTRGFMRMRGTAKSKDLLAVRALVYRCHHEILKEMTEIKNLESNVDILAKDLREDFRQMLAEERKQNRKQDQMLGQMNFGKPLQPPDSQICDQVAKISSKIDGLLSSFSSASPLAPATILQSSNAFAPKSVHMGDPRDPWAQDKGLGCCGPATRARPMPVTVTNAVEEFLQLERSKQLQELQQEFQTLQRWLELVPKGLQAQGAVEGCSVAPQGEKCDTRPNGTGLALSAEGSFAASQAGSRCVGDEDSKQRPLAACLPKHPNTNT